jgi:glycosyltransferase involved in cell wall biosynthesis
MAAVRSPLRLLIAGEGAQREKLERLADSLGMPQRITFLGRVTDDDLIGLYAGCLGVVYPPFDEDYGYITVEAFLARKPVVSVTDAGGVLEFVEDGVNGFVGQPSPAGLADALDRLWDARARAVELGANGAERVKGITWDAVAAALTGEG